MNAAPDAALDRRKVMRYALGAVAGAVALPALAACGTTPAATNSSATSAASSSTAAKVTLLPTTGTPSWPIDVARAQPTAPWSMYATQGSGNSMLLEMVTFGRDLWDNHDNFSFYAQQGTGKGTWTIQVGYMSPTDSWAKAGIMIRQNLTAGSSDYYFVTTIGNGSSMQYRVVPNYGCNGYSTLNPLDATPVYLKFDYEPGKQIVLQDSTDGKTWANTQTIPLSKAYTVDSAKGSWSWNKGAPANAVPDMITGNYYVGLCACSHNPSLQGYAGFTDFTGFDVTKMQYYVVDQGSSKKGNW